MQANGIKSKINNYNIFFVTVSHDQPYLTNPKNGRRLETPLELIEQRIPYLIGPRRKINAVKYFIIYCVFMLFSVYSDNKYTFCDQMTWKN